ncbi:uncharacterized protein LOC128394882 [Panonychus citri]|uniref:uncharacterized protein LOC128394882 n=1 Tax=Panonychus citri TaxID=50023 RepID=UPI002306E5E1|nr:uncharacterized protein LOC128394882 [Panonychus citri]
MLIDVVNAQLKSLRMTPMEAVSQDESRIWIPWYDKQFKFDDAIQTVMESVNPDFIVIDFIMRLPCLEKSSIPWAQLWSANPMMLYHGHLPPATTGFPTDSPKELCDKYISLKKTKGEKIFNHLNNWLISKGVRPHTPDEPILVAESKWINFYTYPEFLDYNDIAPKLAKWVRMDAAVREPDSTEPFDLPESLKDKPGKLIYFSLGSMGSIDLELMKRVISVCAKSPHRFIVSKGPLHEQIDLPDNMWGDRYVNQLAILPHVDLVITHGGNNTLTESLYCSKPLIVLPLFFDQPDNAQRIKEKEIGIRIDTYRFEESELLQAIEKLINDEPLKEKLSTIASTLKSSTTRETVCQLIEKTVHLGKSPFDEDNVLLFAMDGQGHVNAILGLAGILFQAGHEVVIALSKGWEELVVKRGYQFYQLEPESEPEVEKQEDVKDKNNNNDDEGEEDDNGDGKGGDRNEKSFEFFEKILGSLRKDPIEALEQFDSQVVVAYLKWATAMYKYDEPLARAIDTIKPDMVILDFILRLPCLIKGSTPWATLWSCSPVALYRGFVPPEGSGFPLDSPKELWEKFYSLHYEGFKPLRDYLNGKLIAAGVEPYHDNESFYIFKSPYMNIYNYPEALDYNDIAPRPDKYYRMDAVIREPDDKTPFSLPENLTNKPGALIYFSLGSMGCVDIELMKRVISVCAKSPHRFIVSKGPYHEQIDLPDNMWGDRYLNQIAILPHVDLVITHGGNNTLTESLYFGKPLIVLPLFYDQLDNAQRVEDKKLGVRLNTYKFTDNQMLEAIEKLLNDSQLYDRLEEISFNMKNTKTRLEIVKLIEKTAITKKSPE